MEVGGRSSWGVSRPQQKRAPPTVPPLQPTLLPPFVLPTPAPHTKARLFPIGCDANRFARPARLCVPLPFLPPHFSAPRPARAHLCPGCWLSAPALARACCRSAVRSFSPALGLSHPRLPRATFHGRSSAAPSALLLGRGRLGDARVGDGGQDSHLLSPPSLPPSLPPFSCPPPTRFLFLAFHVGFFAGKIAPPLLPPSLPSLVLPPPSFLSLVLLRLAFSFSPSSLASSSGRISLSLSPSLPPSLPPLSLLFSLLPLSFLLSSSDSLSLSRLSRWFLRWENRFSLSLSLPPSLPPFSCPPPTRFLFLAFLVGFFVWENLFLSLFLFLYLSPKKPTAGGTQRLSPPLPATPDSFSLARRNLLKPPPPGC